MTETSPCLLCLPFWHSTSGGGWLFDDLDKSETGAGKNETGAVFQESAKGGAKPRDGTNAAVDPPASSKTTAQLDGVGGSRRLSTDVVLTESQVASEAATTHLSANSMLTTPNDVPLPSQTGNHSDPIALTKLAPTSAPPPHSTLPASPLSLPHATDPLSSTTLIVPPLNFAMVSRGIYRSGHPNERNFEFLRRLSLKTVLYLGTEDYRSNMTNWTASQNITTHHLRLAINKEPTAEMDHADVVKALQLILKPENWPILIHCNIGKYRVGCIVGLVRRLQGWSHTSIFEEYSRFAGTKISDLEFIEVFDLDKVSLAG